MSHAFCADAWKRSDRRTRMWYQENLIKVLQDHKEKQVREIDTSIALGQKLLRILDEPVAKAVPVALHDVVPFEDDSLMKPVEPQILDIIYGSTEKGAGERYLKARNKKAPEDKFFFRLASSWDYGWQQKQSRMRSRDQNHGRCAILRDTFYRKNNLAADPRHYSQPSTGEISICSEYACNFN